MSNGDGGLIGRMRPEEETRRVNTSALWEDVLRPLGQSLVLGLSVIWQIVTVLSVITSWAVAWSETKRLETPIVGDVPMLIQAAVIFCSLFIFGAIVSHERVRWFIVRVLDKDEMSTGVHITVVIVAWMIFNMLFDDTIVYVLIRARVIPIGASVIATASWFACRALQDGLRPEIIRNAVHNSSQAYIADQNNAHALNLRMLERKWELEDREPIESTYTETTQKQWTIADSIIRWDINGHSEFVAATRGGNRRILPGPFRRFIEYVWVNGEIARSPLMKALNISRDDWEAMRNELQKWAIDGNDRPIKSMAEVIAIAEQYGVLTPLPHLEAPKSDENAGTGHGTEVESGQQGGDLLLQAIQKLPRANRT